MLAQIGTLWGMFTLIIQSPTYFNFVLGLNIKQVRIYMNIKNTPLNCTNINKGHILQTGLWSGIPYVFQWIFVFAFSIGCDYLVKADIVSITNVRKLAVVSCNLTDFLSIIRGIVLRYVV